MVRRMMVAVLVVAVVLGAVVTLWHRAEYLRRAGYHAGCENTHENVLSRPVIPAPPGEVLPDDEPAYRVRQREHDSSRLAYHALKLKYE